MKRKDELDEEESEEFSQLKRKILVSPFFKNQTNPRQFEEDFKIWQISKKFPLEDKGKAYYKKLKLVENIEKFKKMEIKNWEHESEDDLIDRYIDLFERREFRRQSGIKDYNERLEEFKKIYCLI